MLVDDIGLLSYDDKHDVFISDDLDITLGYKLAGLNLNFRENMEIEKFYKNVSRFINSVDDEVVFQFVYRVKEGSFKGKDGDYENGLVSAVFSDKSNHFNDSYIKDIDIYLFVSVSQKKKLIDVSLPYYSFSNIVKWLSPKKSVELKDAYGNMADKLKELEDKLVSFMVGEGLSYNKLKFEDVVKYSKEIMNPSTVCDEKIDKDLSLNENICRHAFKDSSPFCFELDGKFIKTVSMVKKPRSITVFSINDILNGIKSKNFIYNVVIKKLDQAEEIKRFKMSKRAAVATMSGGDKGELNRNKKADQEVVELLGFEDELLSSPDKVKLYHLSASISVLADSREEAKKEVVSVVDRLSALEGVRFVDDDYLHYYNYISCLPGNFRKNIRHGLIHTEPLVHFIPIVKNWDGTSDANLYMKNSNEEMFQAHFMSQEMRAYNAVVIGATGGGKSFSIINFISGILNENKKANVVIVDVGGSYKKINEVYGGLYYDVKLDGSFKINPFPTKKLFIKDSKPVDLEYLEFLVMLVAKMTDKKLDNKDKTIIENCIVSAYSDTKEDAAPSIKNIVSIMEAYDIENKMIKDRAKELALNLEQWTKGRYKQLLSSDGATELNNRFVVFDMLSIKDSDVLPIVIFLISSVINERFKKIGLGSPKTLVYDEVARHLVTPDMAQMIQKNYQTIRKSNGQVWAVVQEASKLYLKENEATTRAIVGNSDTKIVLRQNNAEDYDSLEKMGFNPNEIDLMKNMQWVKGVHADFFLKMGDNSVVLRHAPSKLEYWVSTTNGKDLALQDKYLEENKGDLLATIKKLANDFPLGAES
jgi:hypothetical protein